jgi:RNA recognition motif-containing protein
MTDAKHRGFAFVTFSSSADAQDAIDNMDLNEMRGRVIKVNLARPMKGPAQPGGNRASTYQPTFSVELLTNRSSKSGSLKSGSSST